MQAVIAIPPRQTLQKYGGAEQALMREGAGVPLLVRIMATAMQPGVDKVLIIWPDDVDSITWDRFAASRPLQGLTLYKLVCSSMFDPRSAASWAAIAACLKDHFLWLPWNWVTHKRAFDELSPLPVRPSNWYCPALIEKHVVLYGTKVHVMPERQVDGVPITSGTDVGRAGRFLVAHSGKPLDGIYSQFNWLLCRPLVRLLTHTCVTPNWVTVGGSVVAILAALMFARGSYPN